MPCLRVECHTLIHLRKKACLSAHISAGQITITMQGLLCWGNRGAIYVCVVGEETDAAGDWELAATL